ncbi:hypothetical protein [Soonwooa sp.]|uniref:AbiTii domain-containing protein n=1 Tax=Soonwooa sp. TaxID=1938592 RepID=UPI0028A29674|nr:hypothetical protein [Soonwooa sp.]
MIKELIEDLTFDKITLSQALTRAKIIAYKINNDNFKDWLQSEISGYKGNELPNYRIINCDVFADVFAPFTGNRTVPMDVSALENDLELEYSFYKMRMTQSIGTLELGLQKENRGDYGFIDFPPDLTKRLSQMTPEGDQITSIKRRIQLSEVEYIVEQTKQKLLDTLLELNDAFPDFEISFSNKEKSNNEKVQTIINHNIYGNHSNSNIAVGETVTQHLNSQNNIQQLRKELENLGIEKEDIDDLENSIKNESKENLSKKVLIWVGKMATKAVEKGIELQVPLLIETIHQYI